MPGRRTGFFTKIVRVTPTVDAGTNYTAKDNLGGKISFTGVGRTNDDVSNTGVIRSVVLAYKAATTQVGAIRVFFFDADPTASTLTDNDAMDIDDADLGKVLGHVSIAKDAFGDVLVDNAVGGVSDLYIPFDLGAGTTLFAAMMTDAAENLASTSDIILTVGIQQD